MNVSFHSLLLRRHSLLENAIIILLSTPLSSSSFPDYSLPFLFRITLRCPRPSLPPPLHINRPCRSVFAKFSTTIHNDDPHPTATQPPASSSPNIAVCLNVIVISAQKQQQQATIIHSTHRMMNSFHRKFGSYQSHTERGRTTPSLLLLLLPPHPPHHVKLKPTATAMALAIIQYVNGNNNNKRLP